MIAIFIDPEGANAFGLLSALVQPQRLAEGIPEADVREPALLQVDLEGHVIEIGAEGSVSPRHAGRKLGDLKSERAQQFREEPVEIVAEAAAPAHDNLVEV